ncbi:Hypothetical predicted protein [Paramuricea clavata]|uniref:Uncharacterized protein n=1 Tax=Paramuricea clavata TaxID=317549 RepID=A0A6S7FIS4_PARCT|nr:Hypothetical predicted protein [Paramuricea clavata]
MSRMIQEFQGGTSSAEQRDHHEQKPGVQSAFSHDVVNSVSCFEEVGNPFQDERRFIDGSKPVTDTLKKNNLPTLNAPTKKAVSKDKAKVQVLREDCPLFSRLYIACQNRDGNLEDFFTYENQPWPPSLSELGQLRGGVKADLIKCLPNTTPQSPKQPEADVVILDGAVIVQMLQPRTARTFIEYATTVFAPYVLKHLETVRRVDLVWDVYQDDSLKKSLREKRGTGQRRKVLESTRIARDWKSFLRVDENKEELFKLLATTVVSLAVPEGKEIYSTHGENVLCSSNRTDLGVLAPCNHEEADTRLIVHANDASSCGYRRIKIRSNDTDVVVLAVSIVNTLAIDEMWITHGSGKNVHNIPVHAVAASVGPAKLIHGNAIISCAHWL